MFVANAVLQFLAPRTVVRAHCDLPCGVYDPEQARIEASRATGSSRSTPPTRTSRTERAPSTSRKSAPSS